MKHILYLMLGAILFVITGCALSSSASLAADEADDSPPPSSNNAVATTESPIKIKLTSPAGEAIAVLENTPAAQDLLSQLPMTVTFKDFNNTEKIGYPKREIKLGATPMGSEPHPGTLAIYAPWGNLSIFYKDYSYTKDLAPLGKIISGLDNISTINGDFSVTLDKLN